MSRRPRCCPVPVGCSPPRLSTLLAWSVPTRRPVTIAQKEAKGAWRMPTYISLIRYTDQGMRNIKESPKRLDAAKAAFKAAGGELKQWYLALGSYDAVVISEGPDDETAAKLLLGVGALGNVRSETLRVFTEDEYRKLIAALP